MLAELEGRERSAGIVGFESTGTTFPERVEAWEVEAEGTGVAAPESGREERAEGAERVWYEAKRRSP